MQVKLNEKLILKGNVKSFCVFSAEQYPLVLQGIKPDVDGQEHYHQLVMRNEGGHFGEQVNGKWTTIWEIATKSYVDKVITIPLNDFFTHKSENVEIKQYSLKQFGKVITMYLYFKVNGVLPGNGHIFTLKENYRSGYGYAVETIMQAAQPYPVKGSIWVSSDGLIQIYGYEVGVEYYTYVSWICS